MVHYCSCPTGYDLTLRKKNEQNHRISEELFSCMCVCVCVRVLYTMQPVCVCVHHASVYLACEYVCANVVQRCDVDTCESDQYH